MRCAHLIRYLFFFTSNMLKLNQYFVRSKIQMGKYTVGQGNICIHKKDPYLPQLSSLLLSFLQIYHINK